MIWRSTTITIMFNGRTVVVVMPAYNAARTILSTYREVMDQGIVDLVVLVDDASRDETVAIARYGIGCVATAVEYRLARLRLVHSRLFPV